MGRNKKAQIVKEAVRRFHHLPARTIARHVLATHGALYDNDLEAVRSRVRYYLGKNGEASRETAPDKSLFRTGQVKLPQTWSRKRQPYELKPGLWLVLSDVHVPFHKEKPLEQAVKYGQAEKVDGLLLNGDIWDEASVGFWATAHRDFNDELEAFIDFLDWLRQEFPTQPIIYKPGNHEYRLPRYFMSHAPELAESPLAQMETVIGPLADTTRLAGGYAHSLRDDGSMEVELQAIVGSTNQLGFSYLTCQEV